MRIDHLAYQRATNIAAFGFLLQLVAATVLLIFGYRGDEATARFASFYLYTGLIVWLGLIIVFNQHKLERLEALEEGELTATSSGESIFDRSGDEIRVAARRLRMMYKWVMPVASLLFVGILFLLAWIMFDALAGMAGSDGWLELLMTQNKGWLIAVTLGFSVVCFIISRYLAGMAEQKVWQNLRAGAAVMVGNAVVLLGIAVGTIVRYFEIDDVIFFVAWAIPVFMVIVGAEVVLNLLLNLYRPRISGEYPRAAFDSRSLSLLATPDSLVRSLNDAVNYQFGFDITSSWGYQLVLRSSAWLFVLGLCVLLALSTLSVVGGREQGLRLRSGALVGEVHVLHAGGDFAAFAAAVAFLVLLLWLLPLMCPPPMFLLKGKLCSETQVLISPALSFQAKGIALKTHKVLLPCSACLVHKEQRKEGIEDKRSAACRPVHSLARQRDRRRAAARPLCGVRAVTRVLAAGRTAKRERPFI